ncbi:unnamed protein product [Strongylus vulgaris]|uniref:Uncharacterized protein n=1 Tax=Strongylus vulgaris TaxID=40348 RepID=A0A3P7LPS5_STRVU|nr:unnamed protein product [Strongylus vulgaris]
MAHKGWQHRQKVGGGLDEEELDSTAAAAVRATVPFNDLRPGIWWCTLSTAHLPHAYTHTNFCSQLSSPSNYTPSFVGIIDL